MDKGLNVESFIYGSFFFLRRKGERSGGHAFVNGCSMFDGQGKPSSGYPTSVKQALHLYK